MSTIPTGGLHASPAPPRHITVTVDVKGIDMAKAEELRDQLWQSAQQLAKEVIGEESVVAIRPQIT